MHLPNFHGIFFRELFVTSPTSSLLGGLPGKSNSTSPWEIKGPYLRDYQPPWSPLGLMKTGHVLSTVVENWDNIHKNKIIKIKTHLKNSNGPQTNHLIKQTGAALKIHKNSPLMQGISPSQWLIFVRFAHPGDFSSSFFRWKEMGWRPTPYPSIRRTGWIFLHEFRWFLWEMAG